MANTNEAIPFFMRETAEPSIESISFSCMSVEDRIACKTEDESETIVVPYASLLVTVKLNGTPEYTDLSKSAEICKLQKSEAMHGPYKAEVFTPHSQPKSDD